MSIVSQTSQDNLELFEIHLLKTLKRVAVVFAFGILVSRRANNTLYPRPLQKLLRDTHAWNLNSIHLIRNIIIIIFIILILSVSENGVALAKGQLHMPRSVD